MRPAFSMRPATKEDLRSQLRHLESAASEHETAQVGKTVHFFSHRWGKYSLIIQLIIQ